MYIPSLPQPIKDTAVDLQSMGINSYAWKVTDAKKVLDWLKISEEQVIVLGGDFYVLGDGNKLLPTYENWYYEPTGPDDHMKSIKKAEEMLTVTENKDNHSLFVDLTIKTK